MSYEQYIMLIDLVLTVYWALIIAGVGYIIYDIVSVSVSKGNKP